MKKEFREDLEDVLKEFGKITAVIAIFMFLRAAIDFFMIRFSERSAANTRNPSASLRSSRGGATGHDPWPK